MNDKPDNHETPGANAMPAPHGEREDDLARKVLDLPPELPPPRDLWTGVEARIAAKQRRVVVLHRSVAGASMLLAAAAVALVIRSAKSPRESGHLPVPIASESAPTPVVPTASEEREEAIFPEEASYRIALAALEPTFEQEKGSLPEKDFAAVKASLDAIDAAIVVTRASLVDDPEDPDLRAELDAEYEQKIDTMNDVLEWTTRS